MYVCGCMWIHITLIVVVSIKFKQFFVLPLCECCFDSGSVANVNVCLNVARKIKGKLDLYYANKVWNVWNLAMSNDAWIRDCALEPSQSAIAILCMFVCACVLFYSATCASALHRSQLTLCLFLSIYLCLSWLANVRIFAGNFFIWSETKYRGTRAI